IIIFGGVKRIVKVTQLVVPIMAIFYLIVALYIVVTNISEIPTVFNLIISEALGLKEVVGGGIGAAFMEGIRRGLFSNEPGMGSVPNSSACVHVSHPSKQWLVQSLGVFFNTIIICAATAFIIIISGLYPSRESDVIILTQNSMAPEVGSWAPLFVA